MDRDLSKNTLIGSNTADTLANLRSMVMLLREMNFYDEADESCECGLFIVHTLIKNSLEYEIERINQKKT